MWKKVIDDKQFRKKNSKTINIDEPNVSMEKILSMY